MEQKDVIDKEEAADDGLRAETKMLNRINMNARTSFAQMQKIKTMDKMNLSTRWENSKWGLNGCFHVEFVIWKGALVTSPELYNSNYSQTMSSERALSGEIQHKTKWVYSL